MEMYLGDTEILDIDAILGIQRDEPCSLRSHKELLQILVYVTLLCHVVTNGYVYDIQDHELPSLKSMMGEIY